MNIINKFTKKTFLIFSGAILICLTTLMLHSCSNEDGSAVAQEDKTLEASQLASSPEFQSIYSAAEDFGNQYKTKFSKLSASDKIQVQDLLAQVPTENSTVRVDSLIKAASSILNLDLIKSQNIIKKAILSSGKLSEFKSIDKRTFMTEMVKSKGSSSISTKTKRFKVGPESGGMSDAQKVCFSACTLDYVYESAYCLLLPPPADGVCIGVKSVLYGSCMYACSQLP